MSQNNFVENEPFSLGKTKGRGTKSRKQAKIVDVYCKPKDYFQIQLETNQKEVVNFIRSNEISIITADPGCGKTTIALFYALSGLFNREFEQIIITKPNVECGQPIGFLPGEIEEKLAPYKQSYIENIIKIVGKLECEKLIKSGKIRFEPIGFIRGRTFEHACIIADEIQNLHLHDIYTFVTRMADSSKLILLGDSLQTDIKNQGLTTFISIMKNIKGIDYKELDDSFQMRSKLLIHITKNYKQYLLNKNSTVR